MRTRRLTRDYERRTTSAEAMAYWSLILRMTRCLPGSTRSQRKPAWLRVEPGRQRRATRRFAFDCNALNPFRHRVYAERRDHLLARQRPLMKLAAVRERLQNALVITDSADQASPSRHTGTCDFDFAAVGTCDVLPARFRPRGPAPRRPASGDGPLLPFPLGHGNSACPLLDQQNRRPQPTTSDACPITFQVPVGAHPCERDVVGLPGAVPTGLHQRVLGKAEGGHVRLNALERAVATVPRDRDGRGG
ncbi:hypothetical protein [Streptomyces justiciae]|uniref:hypothetical protein n=1 Tax=Streptomyces justiciae TaxID=2780140 RepID=UPI001D1425DD|nr:hypothetical protein [Streptomyces justiciae]